MKKKELENILDQVAAGIRTEQCFNAQRDPALLIEQIVHQVGREIRP